MILNIFIEIVLSIGICDVFYTILTRKKKIKMLKILVFISQKFSVLFTNWTLVLGFN